LAIDKAMKKTGNWLLALLVTAVAGAVVFQNRAARPVDLAPAVTPVAGVIEPGSPTPVYEGCGFMWAYHEDTDMTAKVDAAIKALDSTASATATLFGEDCVYADGHATFSVMETDFHVRSFFDAFNNEEVFGNWMKQVMDVIVQIPREQVQGLMDGFVQFVSVKGDEQTPVIQVPIKKYRDEAQGKTGEELFQFFQNSQ
jgi:hypothetical protein